MVASGILHRARPVVVLPPLLVISSAVLGPVFAATKDRDKHREGGTLWSMDTLDALSLGFVIQE